jgi:hypothetical protein
LLLLKSTSDPAVRALGHGDEVVSWGELERRATIEAIMGATPPTAATTDDVVVIGGGAGGCPRGGMLVRGR